MASPGSARTRSIPYQAAASKANPIEVEVVSLDWKWLFIYPNEGVAAVNQLVVPVGTPVHFRLTSAGVMNSFFVPQLGSQIYTMAGMTTQLNLEADRPAPIRGLSAQFSGDGFSDMRFDVRAVAPDAFAQMGRLTPSRRRRDARRGRVTPSSPSRAKNCGAATYGAVAPQLFEAIVNQWLPPCQVPRRTGRPGHAAAKEGN